MDNTQNLMYFSKLAADIRAELKEKKFSSNEQLYIDMVTLEEVWRDLLLSTREGKDVYDKFISYILDVRANILDCRPYFRIRQKEFISKVNPFIKKRKSKPLYGLRINSAFIQWAMNVYDGPHRKDLKQLSDQIIQIRSDFITKNFPLILNRIKLIHHHSGLEIPDLVAIASNAAIIAIDKFAPTINEDNDIEYTSVILSSIIARINAAVKQNNDSHNLHLYPSDRKVFIEVCRLKKDNLTDEVIAKKLGITEFDVYRFLNAVVIDNVDRHDKIQIRDDMAGRQLSETIEEKNEQQIINKIAKELPLLQRKILYLKGMLTYDV